MTERCIFVRKPSIDRFVGVCVGKDTVLDYESATVRQHLENLVLHTVAAVSGNGYQSTVDTTLTLNEGDILIYEESGRGYIKPVEAFCTIAEAIDDFENIKDLG